jgi:hypothetical protein
VCSGPWFQGGDLSHAIPIDVRLKGSEVFQSATFIRCYTNNELLYLFLCNLDSFELPLFKNTFLNSSQLTVLELSISRL